jgi:hypothetical protein
LPQIRNVSSSKLLLGNLRPGNLRPNDRYVQLLNESLYAEMLIPIYKTPIVVIVVKSVWLVAIANCISKYFYVGGLQLLRTTHTWRTGFSFFVRPINFGLSGKGGPTRRLSSRRLRPERDVGLQERDGRCEVGTGRGPEP